MAIPSEQQALSAVAIWLVSLPADADAACFGVCETLLDQSERQAAGSFRAEPARRQYVAAHALVRLALSFIESHMSPSAWTFERGPFGKPRACGSGGPFFNLSHTDRLVAVAVCPSGEVGLDVERHDRPIDPAAMTSVLSQAEQAELISLHGGDQRRRFFEIWTAKEAYAKASGRGITAELKTVQIKTMIGQDGSRHGRFNDWQIHQFEADGHWVALASRERARPRVAQLSVADLARVIVEGKSMPVPQ